MLKVLLVLAATAFALYVAVLALMWWKQEALLFYPEPLPPDHPLARAPDLHERTVEVEGARLSVLHLKLPAPRGVVFYLHGNAGNLASWSAEADFFRAANFDLVMPDYRGFGKSTGRIADVGQLRDDVRAAWAAFAGDYAGRPVVIAGRSLGTGLAADLAEHLANRGQPPALTVLITPYASLRAMTADVYPWVPGLLLRYPLDTARHLPRIPGPVLLLHAERDTLIGLHHAHALQRAAPAARLVVVPGADHNNLQAAPAYREALHGALSRAAQGPTSLPGTN